MKSNEKYLGKIYGRNFYILVEVVSKYEKFKTSFFIKIHVDQLFIYTFLYEIICINK